MELNNFTVSCGQESPTNRNQTGSERDMVYDSVQETLDTCNRELEELKLQVLKTSVRCHMLEVDLATQFNPRNQQSYVEAQEACDHCSETLTINRQHVLLQQPPTILPGGTSLGPPDASSSSSSAARQEKEDGFLEKGETCEGEGVAATMVGKELALNPVS